MAKIVCEFDTITKIAKITKDGEVIENATALEVYPYDMEKHSCRVYMTEFNEDDNILTQTYMYASKDGELEEKTVPGLPGALKHIEYDEESPEKSLAKIIANHIKAINNENL